MAWPDFASLKTELSDRGFAYLSDGRLGRYINQARAEIDDLELWPYREASTSGASPLTVSDLGTIASVWDSGANANLTASDRRSLVDRYRDMTTTGSPRFFYVDSGNIIRTYPVGGTLTVRYYKTSSDLVNSTDLPLLPARFAYIIVDAAARRAYIDADAFDKAAAVQVEVQRMLDVMKASLLMQQTQDDLTIAGSGSDW